MQISGVNLVSRRRIYDDRGGVFHMLRNDDPEYQEFGEIYFSQVNPNLVKAWTLHTRMVLNYLLLVGSIHLVIFDSRENSTTRGLIQEIEMNESDSKLVTIPAQVWYGFKGLGKTPSLLANCATLPHDPQETMRRPVDDPYIPYHWD